MLATPRLLPTITPELETVANLEFELDQVSAGLETKLGDRVTATRADFPTLTVILETDVFIALTATVLPPAVLLLNTR